MGGAQSGGCLSTLHKSQAAAPPHSFFLRSRLEVGRFAPSSLLSVGKTRGPPPHLPLSHRAERVCSGTQPSFGGPAASALSIPSTGPGETLAKPPLCAQRPPSKADSSLPPHKGCLPLLPSLPAPASFPSCSPGKGLRVGGQWPQRTPEEVPPGPVFLLSPVPPKSVDQE